MTDADLFEIRMDLPNRNAIDDEVLAFLETRLDEAGERSALRARHSEFVHSHNRAGQGRLRFAIGDQQGDTQFADNLLQLRRAVVPVQ